LVIAQELGDEILLARRNLGLWGFANIFTGKESCGKHLSEQQRAHARRKIGANNLSECDMRQTGHRSKYDGKVNSLPIAKRELSQPTRSELRMSRFEVRRRRSANVEVRSAKGSFDLPFDQRLMSSCFSSHEAPIPLTLSFFTVRTSIDFRQIQAGDSL
jgi:hypothetical protein